MSRYKRIYDLGHFDGMTFGKWTVKGEAGFSTGRRRMLRCNCQCGKIRTVYLSLLLRGKSTQCKACSVGSEKPCERWSESELEILRGHYLEEGALLSRRLPNRSQDAIKKMAQKMGLKSNRKQSRGKPWPQDYDDLILQEYAKQGASKLSKLIDTTADAIRHRARRLGIRKTKLTEEEKKVRIKQKLKAVYQYRVQHGLCKKCGKPAMPSSERCLFHWGQVIAGGSCRKYDNKFVESILALLERQNYKCALSGRQLIPAVNASLDHDLPVSRGGTSDIENLQWVTYELNVAKRDSTSKEFIALCEDVVRCANARVVPTQDDSGTPPAGDLPSEGRTGVVPGGVD